MSMKRCGNGHYFDPAKHESCPYCGVQAADSSHTVPANAAAGIPNLQKPASPVVPDIPAAPATPVAPAAPVPPAPDSGPPAAEDTAEGFQTVAEKGANLPTPPETPKFTGSTEGETIALIRRKTGIDPVTGWLVCIEGPDRGRDYRIRNEKNFIGRSERMDINISGDDSISRENHSMVSYDPRKMTTKLHPGEGRGIVYLNGDELDVPTVLQPYDIIEMGQSKFIFIPFCGEKFQWD